MAGVGRLRALTRQIGIRLYKPVYGSLPACRGRSDEEVERLTRVVYRRKPRLIIFPVVFFLLFLISMLLPRPLSRWIGISMIWTLSLVGLAFGVPMVMYEQRVHRPAVDSEMARVLAEQGDAPTKPGAAAKQP